MMDKAYKILALHKNISNRMAKELLDNGMVFSNGKRLEASKIIPLNTAFNVIEMQESELIFEDSNIIAINKPAFMDSTKLLKKHKGWVLLNRLDKDTSGVVMLVKEDSSFREEAIREFKEMSVYKEYLALCNGIIAEEMEITKPIESTKGNNAFSKIDFKNGKKAITYIAPLRILGKKTLLSVVIKTGRTHQIRVHLKSINHPILGDKIYGKIPFKRLMLHSYKIKIFEYEFVASKGDFWKYLQE